ncbi:MAG TPA: tRNA preQ1(34) S-adenosylmethionine ribosyltransferase-isomerase QueA [Anaerolineales bacterium]|nr:tRNA preQ1(34) S-adenosylmethionine ribosyltransferase-isomerase QueA [Anaerolineales bacterium]
MRTDDFDYDLPQRFIAQRPAEPRDASRLLVLDRSRDQITHALFRDLPSYLNPGDVLVLNETRVIPARLHARKRPGGGVVELLLLRRIEPRLWEVMVGGRGLTVGTVVDVEGGPEGTIEAAGHAALRVIRFSEPIAPLLDSIGSMPLPPYIREPLRSPDEYQTVYARTPGSAAAPTAGLHFTPALLQAIADRGVVTARIVLHVGLDTFAPVTVEDPTFHPIHRELCRLDPPTAQVINQARPSGGRVIAVGTTTVRTLETAARHALPGETVGVFEGETDLLILPGNRFQAVDTMITNFHLPRSTLLMLVAAFAGRERILAAYETAKAEGYRFYSFGDAMLIV